MPSYEELFARSALPELARTPVVLATAG